MATVAYKIAKLDGRMELCGNYTVKYTVTPDPCGPRLAIKDQQITVLKADLATALDRSLETTEALQDYQRFMTELQASIYWTEHKKKWAGECISLAAWDPSTSPAPTVTSHFGKAVVAAGQIVDNAK